MIANLRKTNWKIAIVCLFIFAMLVCRACFENTSNNRPNSYKDISKSTLTRRPAVVKPEVRHVAFLKVHKAASTTLQTIFFRFGYSRNLTFVLPKDGHYVSKSTAKHEPLIVPQKKGHYDILCNHGYFNYSVYSSLMPNDTVYLAIVRDPWSQFVSAFHYYSALYHFPYLEKIPGNKMESLISHPDIFEEAPLSYTMNSMAKDFGFSTNHYYEINSGKSESTRRHLQHIGKTFHLVLIKEYMDESIVLMKRLLGWSLKDILYIPKNVISPDTQISSDLMKKFQARNRLDYLVYEYFLDKFKTEVKKHGDSLLAETLVYKSVLLRVQNWCFDQYFGELFIEASDWNEQFTVTSLDCTMMAKPEIDFIDLLKGASSKH